MRVERDLLDGSDCSALGQNALALRERLLGRRGAWYKCRPMGWFWVWAILLGAVGCDRLPEGGGTAQEEGREEQRVTCRRGCGETYKACTKGCVNDALQECEKRFDVAHQRCDERCRTP